MHPEQLLINEQIPLPHVVECYFDVSYVIIKGC